MSPPRPRWRSMRCGRRRRVRLRWGRRAPAHWFQFANAAALPRTPTVRKLVPICETSPATGPTVRTGPGRVARPEREGARGDAPIGAARLFGGPGRRELVGELVRVLEQPLAGLLGES